MKKTYEYKTCCVNASGRDIENMVDSAIEITYNTFRKHVPSIIIFARENGYATGRHKKGLRLKDDYAVSFHRGKYRGKRCYYIRHSAIEYIYV